MKFGGRSLLLVFGCFLSLSMFGCSEDQPSQTPSTGRIVGRITDAATGQPILNVSVVTLPPTQAVVTDNTGAFTLNDVIPGTYVVSVNKLGYNSQTVSVTVAGGKSTIADIQLTTGAINQPPTLPEGPDPSDGATDQPTSLMLSWSASEPDGDGLNYDVFFGTTNPPSTMVAEGISSSSLVRSGLSNETEYYWQVVAKDSKGAMTSGPVWRFTTIVKQQTNINAGLVAFYPFNGTADDASGHRHDGLVQDGVTPTSDRRGNPNSAFRFNGTPSGYISVPHSDKLNFPNGSRFTIAAWVKFSSTLTQFTGILAKGKPNGGNVGYQLFVVNGSRAGFDVTSTGGTFRTLEGAKSLNDGQWHFIVCTASTTNGETAVYIDGVLDRSGLYGPLNCAIDNDRPLFIGKERNSTLFFNGSIDDVRIYNRIITSEEMQLLYTE